jgi:hypothetical protein
MSTLRQVTFPDFRLRDAEVLSRRYGIEITMQRLRWS